MSMNRMELNPQTPPAMEAFEQRLLLAGNVLAEITNAGDLIITGDDAANKIVITEVAGTVKITRADADTSVNGNADVGDTGVLIDGAFSRNIKIKMGDGDDVVVILGDYGGDGLGGGNDVLFAIDGNVQIDLGDGVAAGADQEAILNLIEVGGSVKITSKDDNDANVDIERVSVGKNVQIALGGGNNDASVIDTTISGNLKIANKDGTHNVTLDNADVTGSVSISNGSGMATVSVRGGSEIGKNLSIKNKDMTEVGVGDKHEIDVIVASVGGNMKISNGKGDTDVLMDISNVGKNLSITSKGIVGDTNTVNVSNMDLGTADKRTSLKISAGKGTGTTNVAAVNAGSLTVKGKGITNITVGDGTEVTKKTTLTGGKAATTIAIETMTATGGLQIKGGGKAVGDGVLDVNINYLTGGAKSKVSITGGGDADILNIDDLTVDSLQIKTGKGNDIVNVEMRITSIAIADVSTVGTLTLSTGDGDDTVAVGVGGSVERGLILTGKGNLNGGKGTDTLNAAAARGNIFDEDLLTVKNFELGDSIV